MRGDEPPQRQRPRPDQRPHGRWHDLARAPPGSPHSRWVTRTRNCTSDKSPAQRRAFCFSESRVPPMKHFLNTQDLSRAELDALLAAAARFKRAPVGEALKGKSIALVFFNASLRTRASFELGAFQLGGHAIVLQPGKDAWPIEFDLGT